jgi:hypothetical protein
MALQLSLTYLQQDSCGEMVFTDSTGAYNVTTNPYGWGAPNLPVDDGTITYAELIVSRYSDGSTLEVVEIIDLISTWEDLTTLTSDPFDTGTTVSNVIYTIPSSVVNFTDGVYQITYQVGDGTTYANSTNKSTVTYNIATYCNIECCIEQRLANSPTEYTCVTCNNDYLNITGTLWTLLQALKLAACSASIDAYLTILTTLQTACEEAGMSCN